MSGQDPSDGGGNAQSQSFELPEDAERIMYKKGKTERSDDP